MIERERCWTGSRASGVRLTGDRLDYEVDLASTNFPMSFHLRATVLRVEEPTSDGANG